MTGRKGGSHGQGKQAGRGLPNPTWMERLREEVRHVRPRRETRVRTDSKTGVVYS